MIRLRALCPDSEPGLVDNVLDVLSGEPGAVHVVRLRGVMVDPPGDVVEADLARESVDGVLEALRGFGCGQRGGIVLETLDTVVSDAADRAEEAAPGEGVDAVVWDELLARTGQGARLSVTFVVMLTIACLLAAIGVVTNSPVTVVGRDGARARVRPARRAGRGRGAPRRSDGADGRRWRWARASPSPSPSPRSPRPGRRRST